MMKKKYADAQPKAHGNLHEKMKWLVELSHELELSQNLARSRIGVYPMRDLMKDEKKRQISLLISNIINGIFDLETAVKEISL